MVLVVLLVNIKLKTYPLLIEFLIIHLLRGNKTLQS